MAIDDATLAQPSPLDTDEIPVVVVAPPPRPVWSRTWALGGVAVMLAGFAALTGLGLMFHYRPVTASAHLDLVDLAEASRFAFVRELHRWGAHALLIATALHLFRIVLAGAYRPPRHLNYAVGVALGLVILGAAMTGYVLPWDQHSRWLLGWLSEPGDATLTFVYALHCGVLPVAGAILIFYHLKRARRDALVLEETAQDSEEP